jgi:nitroimidazol reductase NimA-like FMN-containing flavoprotein (pyridoxamine 5'-phosphate oxidase superfamily)
MSEEQAPINDLTKLRREPSKGDSRWETIKAILTENYLCHLAFSDQDGQPFAVPTIHALIGDDLYVHGSAASRTLKSMQSSTKVCVTVTQTTGFVFARSILNHSINYRCAMVFGEAQLIDAPGEKEKMLEAYFEEVFPGRWQEARIPTEKEYAQVAVLKIPLDQASAKISAGPPEDEDYDYELDNWAGVIPIGHTLGETEPDPALRPNIPEAASLAKIRERWS